MKRLHAMDAKELWSRWRLFMLCIAIPRLLMPNFGHRLSTQFSVEVLGASRTNLGVLASVRHWVGLVSNPLGGYLARTRGIKWLIVSHNVRCPPQRHPRLADYLLPPRCPSPLTLHPQPHHAAG